MLIAFHDVAVHDFIVNQIDEVLNKNPILDVVLCGDFNRLNTSFITTSCNLVNLHCRPTYGSAELDYILLSEELSSKYTISIAEPIDTSTLPHVSLLATPILVQRECPCTQRYVMDLRRSNVSGFLEMLTSCDWSFVDKDGLSLDEKCEQFHKQLEGVLTVTIPRKIVTFSENTKPWVTPVLKSLINDRWNAYRQKQFSQYDHLKRKVKEEIEKSKLLWINKMKKVNIWKAIDTVCPRKVSDPMRCICMKYNSMEAAACAINENLARVFSVKVDLPLRLDCTSSDILAATEWQVQTILKNLKPHKASPEIPVKLYKAAASIIAKPLTLVINNSFENADVPALWKTSAIIPLPKTSTPQSVDDIRPISLLPIPSKILELAFLQFAKPLLLQQYGEDQFGFRPGSSTTCALIVLHDHVTRFMERSDVTGVQIVTYDLSKAFDRLKHDVIIKRFIECGLPGRMIYWLSNYLENRRQCVKIGIESSSYAYISSGVPQGSLLGPFLFSVVMASLTIQNSNCRIIKYADDVTLCMPIIKNSSNSHITDSHEELSMWSISVGLKLNEKKCKALVVPRSKTCQGVHLSNVQIVDQMPLLGVTFNAKWTWSDHVDKVVRSASRRLFPLRMLKPKLNTNELRATYYAIVRSVLEYAGPLLIGLSVTDALRLDKVQARFH